MNSNTRPPSVTSEPPDSIAAHFEVQKRLDISWLLLDLRATLGTDVSNLLDAIESHTNVYPTPQSPVRLPSTGSGYTTKPNAPTTPLATHAIASLVAARQQRKEGA